MLYPNLITVSQDTFGKNSMMYFHLDSVQRKLLEGNGIFVFQLALIHQVINTDLKLLLNLNLLVPV